MTADRAADDYAEIARNMRRIAAEERGEAPERKPWCQSADDRCHHPDCVCGNYE